MKVLIVVIGIGALTAGCGSGSSGSSPTAPATTALANSTWTGTLTRPGTLPAMTISWKPATQDGMGLSGPLTLTNGGVSVTFPAVGVPSGNEKSGFSIFVQFKGEKGSIASIPSCSVLGNSPGTTNAFPSPYNKITIATFTISYNSCNGFVETGVNTTLTETGQLTLSK